MRVIGGWIADILDQPRNESLIRRIGDRVADLCGGYPLYGDLAGPA
jgi:glycine/serine hydroxymethyltransferase